MPRATTRSQRPTQASQSQYQSQTQRGKRAVRREEEDDEDEDEENENGYDDPDGDVDMDAEACQARRGGDSDNEIVRKANDLVRFALFKEQKRVPMRRDEISKKVLGSNSRSFNAVMEHAQGILKRTFGMEIVELRARAVIQAEGDGAANDDLDEARKATGVKKRGMASLPRSHNILRSVLDPFLIEYAAQMDEAVFEAEAQDAPDSDDEEEEFKSYGSIIAWSNSDQLGSIGILYVVLALILVHGRVISDMDLRMNLKRLRLSPNATVSFNARSTQKSLSVEGFLRQLSQQGYIISSKIGDAKGAKRGRGGGTATQGDDTGATYEWRWGNRAECEVGEKAIAKFMAEFMVERMDFGEEGEEEDGRARGLEEAQRKIEQVTKGVERAAGGTLVDIHQD